MGNPTTPAPASGLIAEIETGLDLGLKMTAVLAGPVSSMGGPSAAAIGALVGRLAATADTILEQVEGDAAILASGDVARIRALQQELQAQNKQLAAQIAGLPT